jgi:hypothetical protein
LKAKGAQHELRTAPRPRFVLRRLHQFGSHALAAE